MYNGNGVVYDVLNIHWNIVNIIWYVSAPKMLQLVNRIRSNSFIFEWFRLREGVNMSVSGSKSDDVGESYQKSDHRTEESD